MARLFNSILDEYLFGSFPSMKLNISPQCVCPIVGVEGLKDVLI